MLPFLIFCCPLQPVFCFFAELDLRADRRFAPALYFFIDAAVDIYRASFFFIDHVVWLEKMGFVQDNKLTPLAGDASILLG